MGVETLSRSIAPNSPEKTKNSERLEPHFPFITLNGPAGTGKSTLAEDMSKDLHIPIFDVGAIYRRWERIFGNKSDVIGYAPRAVEVDQKLHAITERKMMNAYRSGRPVIIVSREGAWIAKELEDKGFAKAPKFLFTVSKREGARRVWEREKKRNPAFSKTQEQVRQDINNRNVNDYKALQAAFPNIPGNPMDPGFRDEDGRRIYDKNKTIHTDKLSVSEVKKVVYDVMEQEGYLRRAA